MQIHVFAYASLADPASAAITLGREIEPGALLPARLEGWRRRFSQARDNHRCEKTFARRDDGSIPDWILGMNIEPAGDREEEAPNGALIPVTVDDLACLDARELRYERVEVTESIVLSGDRARLQRVDAYVARRRHFRPTPPPGAVILRSYADAIEAAFGQLGPEQLEQYRRTTLPYPVELIDATLIRDEIPPGNPREW